MRRSGHPKAVRFVTPYRLVLLTQGIVGLGGAVLSLVVAAALVEVKAFDGWLVLLGIAISPLLEATIGFGRRRVRRNVIPRAVEVEAVRQEPLQRHVLKAAGVLVVVVALLTFGFVIFETTGFGVVPSLVALHGVRDLWTASWLGRWEREAGKRLLQESDWPMPVKGRYYLQPLGSASRAGAE